MKTCLLVTTTFWPLKHMSSCRVKESQTYLYMILLIQNPKQTKLTRAVQSQGSSYTSRGKDWKGTQRGLLGNWQCSAFKNTVLMTRESYSVCRNSLSYVLVSAHMLPSSEELKKKKNTLPIQDFLFFSSSSSAASRKKKCFYGQMNFTEKGL